MKTYCKNIDILNIDFIESCVAECLRNKYSRRKTISFLCEKSGKKKLEIINIIHANNRMELDKIIHAIAVEIQEHIRDKNITLPPIKFYERYDEVSRKNRIIGVQSMIHQCYEYVAVNACKELFFKKFGVYQCASIPDRGQSYGKRAIEKWMKNDPKGTKYAIKADVKKCYPSVDRDNLKKFLYRDLHKNQTLLYLLFTLIDQYDTGLSIGSHLAQWLCNYYLSYGYHFISEKLFTVRKSKRDKKIKRIRLLSHVIFYMDDIHIFGNNKKYLFKAMEETLEYFKNVLHLTIKPDWRLYKVYYVDKNKKVRGAFVDMMGFRFYRGKTTIRQSVFLRTRRKYLELKKKLIKHELLTQKFVQSAMSYWGWIKHTDSYKISKKICVSKLTNVARKKVSYYARLALNKAQPQPA